MVKSKAIRGFLLYRIWYGDKLVYVGRTKQPLQNRIRGHLFAKPMHRVLDIEQITKIEYAQFKTEADMNLYEIYFILIWRPPMNVDDKARDLPTVELPSVEWKPFETPLWEKWKTDIEEKSTARDKKVRRLKWVREQQPIIRAMHRSGEITAFELENRLVELKEEERNLVEELYGHSYY